MVSGKAKDWYFIPPSCARKYEKFVDNSHCVTTCVKDQSSGLEGLFNFQVHEAEELW